jgi:molecular chaperone DnaK (HSP70)
MSLVENYYQLLQLDPNVDDRSTIERALDVFRSTCSSKANQGVPKDRRKAALYLEQLGEIKRVMLEDPLERRQHSQREQQRQDQMKHEAVAKFQECVEELEARLGGGVVTDKDVAEVIRRQGGVWDEARVRKELERAGVKLGGTAPDPRPKREVLDSALAATIREGLDLLGISSLYALLGDGATQKSGTERLLAQAETQYKKLFGQTDSLSSAKLALYSECKTLFSNDTEKNKYDNTLAMQAMEQFKEQLELGAKDSRFVTNGLVNLVLLRARKAGVAAELALDWIEEYAEKRKWLIEPRTPTQVEPGADLIQQPHVSAMIEAYTGTDPYLFVSYAHSDSKVVYPEIARLNGLGYRIWYDEGICPSHDWPESIATALERCDFFVVFVSTRAVASKNVRDEIHFALHEGKPFLAIYLEDTLMPPGLKMRMGSIQAISKFQIASDRYLRQLEKALPIHLTSRARTASILQDQAIGLDQVVDLHQEQKTARLQEEGENRLAAFVREALIRTSGKPTPADTTAANELIRQYRTPKERAKAIVRTAREQWEKERSQDLTDKLQSEFPGLHTSPAKASRARIVYGIDLGTTHSCIAAVDESGRPIVYANSNGDFTTPSVVYFESESNVVVGQDAKDIAALFPKFVVSMVKRSMGMDGWKYEHGGQCYRPEQITAFILRKVVQDAEAIVGRKIEDVVITCPAYFGVNQREATKQAGQLAGLNVIAIIPEPTAAAIAHGLLQKNDQSILAYHLGGGTFDLTAIKIENGAITVVATDGDRCLGGDDWDNVVVRYFARCFENEIGTPADELLADADTYQFLLLAAEKCKKALSTKNSVKQPIQHGTEKIVVEFKRDKFDELTRPLLDRTIVLLRKVLDTAKSKGLTNFDKVLLVGGSTYMPQVQQRIKQEMACEILQTDPNQIVAKGAAIYGLKCEQGIRIQEDMHTTGTATNSALRMNQQDKMSRQLLNQLADTDATNVSSKSIGICALDSDNIRKIFNLFCVDDNVPTEITQDFIVKEDGQTTLELELYENVSRVRGDCAGINLEMGSLLGKLEVDFRHPLPRGTPIQMTFSLDRDGQFTIRSREPTTGREAKTALRTRSKLGTKEQR